MQPKVINLDRTTHETVQRLLPWFVADSLHGEERDLVQEHLRTCSQCQADSDWELKLRSAVADELAHEVASPNVEEALARLQPRLENKGLVFIAKNLMRSVRDAWQFSGAGMRAAVALQFVAIAGLCCFIFLPQQDNSYRALGQASATGANLVVMFKPDITEMQMRQILAANSARVVDGPTVTGAYLLAIPVAQRTKVLGRLKSEASVSMAEPLDIEGGDHH